LSGIIIANEISTQPRLHNYAAAPPPGSQQKSVPDSSGKMALTLRTISASLGNWEQSMRFLAFALTAAISGWSA
jgi:hypothetical protein